MNFNENDKERDHAVTQHNQTKHYRNSSVVRRKTYLENLDLPYKSYPADLCY